MAPDGGWGWVVLFGSFISYFIADGWSYSFGMLFPEMVDYFAESKGKTAWIGTLLYGIPMLICVVICALISAFGCRAVAVAGGLITGLSFVITAFATSVNFMCASIGVLSSFGLAMTYVPALVVVTYYFDRRRGLATGLAVTGSGLGAFVFPPLLTHLMDVYTWRGMLLLMGGVGLNLMLTGALYRPLEDVERHLDIEDTAHQHRNEDVKLINMCRDNVQSDNASFSEGERQCSSSDAFVGNEAVELRSRTPVESLRNLSENGLNKQEHVPDNCLTASREHIQSNNPDVQITCKNSLSKVKGSTSKSFKNRLETFLHELQLIPESIFDKSLFTNGPYMLYCAANFILYLWVSVPYIYLVDKALLLEVGVDDAVFLLSIIGISRTVGQLVIGMTGDHPKISANFLFAAGIFIIGAGTAVVPQCTSHAALAAYSAVFGCAVSVTYVLPMMCLVEIVGLEKATNAFGPLQL